jgi:hypothetical protein
MNMHGEHCYNMVENNPGASDHGLSITLYMVPHMVQMTRVG